MKRIFKCLTATGIVLLLLWLIAEIGVRLYLELPLETGFYGSIPQEKIAIHQAEIGVQTTSGAGWVHLGWIADPERERYSIVRVDGARKTEVGQAIYGSFLTREAGIYQVWAEPKDKSAAWLVGEVYAEPGVGESKTFVPAIDSPWNTLFKPQNYGNYVNDHTIYQDKLQNWRLVGITSRSDGDFNAERYFTVGFSQEFPPSGGMQETEPIADFGELAWAPHVIEHQESYHMFWSPHKLHQMTSEDGIQWQEHQITLSAPHHKFFRDPMVLQVADSQWLLYTTARSTYFSQIDIYQSFDLKNWQFIGSALRSGWGSERNSPFSSMESPFVVQLEGHYYLFTTYNNDSFFWPGILMLFQIWPDKPSYKETLVFHSDNPYDFGMYRGKNNSATLLTELEAHAPEIIYQSGANRWYITTAGWPWVATLTSGEVAISRLKWEPLP